MSSFRVKFGSLFLLFLLAGALAASATPLKEGGFVEFVAKDGTMKYGTFRYVAKDCWVVTTEGEVMKLLAKDIAGSESTGERLDIKARGSNTKVRYPICRLTMVDGRTIMAGFSANLSMWIDDQEGGIHRQNLASHKSIKAISALPGKGGPTGKKADQTASRTGEKPTAKDQSPSPSKSDAGQTATEDQADETKGPDKKPADATETAARSADSDITRPKTVVTEGQASVGLVGGYVLKGNKWGTAFSYPVNAPGKLRMDIVYATSDESWQSYDYGHGQGGIKWSSDDGACSQGSTRMPRMIGRKDGDYVWEGKVETYTTIRIKKRGTIKFSAWPESSPAKRVSGGKWMDDWYNATHTHALGGTMSIKFTFTPDESKDVARPKPKTADDDPEKKPEKKELVARYLSAFASPSSVVGDAMSVFTIKVTVRDANRKPVNNAVVAVSSPGNKIHSHGPHATDRNGVVRVKCRVRELVAQEKPIKNVLTISHSYLFGETRKTIEAKVPIILKPCPRVIFRMVDLKAKPVAEETLHVMILEYPKGFVDWITPVNTQFRLETDEKGLAWVWVPAGTKVGVSYQSAIYAVRSYPRNTRRMTVSPGTEVLLRGEPGTALQEIRAHFLAFLGRAGVPKEALHEISEIELRNVGDWKMQPGKFSGIEYVGVQEPTRIMSLLLEVQKNLVHELGHCLSMHMDKGKKVGGEHPYIWKPCDNEELGFEEAEAHFLAQQYLRTFGYPYDEKMTPEASPPKDIERGSTAKIEGVVAAFLNSYYQAKGSTADASPEEAVADFKETIARAQKAGRHLRTIDDFIAEKARQPEGLHIPDEELDKLLKKYKLQ